MKTRLHLSKLFALVVSLVGLGLASPAAAQPQDTSEATAERPQMTADELAQKLVETTGDPREVDKLAFTFVVEVGGQQKVSRRSIWWPKDGRLKVTHGDETTELKHLHDHDLSKLAKAPAEHAETWQKIAPEADPETAAKAWGWFINDSYWLLAPAKVMDPGVNRKIDDEGRLILTFGDVGLTPGDTYRLTVDRDRGVVTRWQFELQSGRKGAFRWTDYETFGPLKLSTRRVSKSENEADARKLQIRFENIEVKSD